jgi:hypothetical protein
VTGELRRQAVAVELKRLSRALLKQAVGIYMEEAYGGGPVPPAVEPRLQWGPGETLEALAAADAFERTPADVPMDECERLRLRLGNRAYPHMKFGADRVPDTGEWVLTVDCHDRQLLAVVQEDERAALEALIRANNDMKGRIERRWTEAGLPTFQGYIRQRLARQGGAGQET